MRRFRDIVEDIKAPSPQSLWLDKGKLKFFGTKGWTSMAGEEEPDLSGYAKLNGATFTGEIKSNIAIRDTPYIWTSEQGTNKVPNTRGSITNVGVEDSFIFTLEDGSKVTKSIRVVSTTTTPAT